MAKARMLGMKTGFTPNSQADRLRCSKAYRRGRKAERQYQRNAAAKGDIDKIIAAVVAVDAAVTQALALSGQKGENHEANRCI